MCEFLTQIENIASCSPRHAELEELASSVGNLGHADVERLVALCRFAVSDSRAMSCEKTRVAVAKVVVSCVPTSQTLVSQLLAKRTTDQDYEMHFSLFCFLDQVRNIPWAEEFASQVPTLVESYLMHIATDRAEAAWMAGDLLGDHWPSNEGIPPLVRIAENGRHVAGRQGAIHGLEQAMKNLGDDPRRREIVSLLVELASNDPEPRIRQYASLVLPDGDRSAP